ncbi:hypothetical protein Bpfe_029591 [Biomphalaria pfeifferi]|uniref:Uncharacterized protein n=1 Tax=Biomphalaria pfeifferi TaxID=112525 RepID=A0AAD8EW49_BIOPF|nr:hypothetical protein Bpfe_029591 [Biomphalaria pfeifferi]
MASSTTDNSGCVTTRSMSELWLIGQTEPCLPQNVLPTYGQVLRTVLHNTKILKKQKTISYSAQQTVDDLLRIWSNARVPVALRQNIVTKMNALVDEYNLLKKNKGRCSATQSDRETVFKNKLSIIFDIADKDADRMIKIEEDRIFLTDQRGPRLMKMAGIDKNLTRQEERSRQRKEAEYERRKREQTRKAGEASVTVSTWQESGSESNDSMDSLDTDHDDYEIEIPVYYKKQVADSLKPHENEPKKPRILQTMLNSSDVSSTLDRINLSDRKFTVLAAAIARANGEDVGTGSLSRSTVHRKRSLHRSMIETDVREEFRTRSKSVAVIHWDGKIMENSTDKNNPKAATDRLAVVVSGLELEKMLGIIKIPSGTGEAQAHATMQLLLLWERFKKAWPNIDQTVYRPLDDPRVDDPSDPFLQELKHATVSFLQNMLLAKSGYMPREDYREVTELCLLILNTSVCDQPYSFRAPGAYHLARWMAKLNYSFKIYLFRDQFKVTPKELKSLREFCLFASLIYVKAWIAAPVTCDAATNDLVLFREICQYARINKAVADAARQKLEKHLWYISPELISFALFSEKVPVSEKRSIVRAMSQAGDDWSDRAIKLEDCTDLAVKELHALVAASSTSALRSIGIDISFLHVDPETWKDLPAYVQAKSVIGAIKVVNDSAERSVALMSTFNKSITKSETEMQTLLQVVEDNRKRIPDSQKSTLTSYKTRGSADSAGSSTRT